MDVGGELHHRVGLGAVGVPVQGRRRRVPKPHIDVFSPLPRE